MNDEQRRKMGEAGYLFASDKFSKEKEIDNTKAFYFSLLK
jgi:glycosyltransferase involved in cell wall biosynthesis